MRALIGIGSAGTETVDMLSLVQEGKKHYLAGNYEAARVAFAQVAAQPVSVRKLKVSVGEVVTIAAGHAVPQQLRCYLQKGVIVRVVDSDAVAQAIQQVAYQGGSGEMFAAKYIAREPVAQKVAPVERQARAEAEAEVEAARREWKTRFRARTRMMQKLLANAADDTVPTPRGDGDD